MSKPETGMAGVIWSLVLLLPVAVWLALAILGTVDPDWTSALFSAAGATVHAAKALL